MRTDVVLHIAREEYPWITPAEIHRMGRSARHGCRYFLIWGGPKATGGWQDFQETFKVDDMESARYLSWYYNLLTQLYVNDCTTADVQKILISEPTSYLPRDFYEATGQAESPALVLVNHGAKSIIGAHAKITEERVDWRLEPRYANLFNRIASLAVAYITLYHDEELNLLVGWVWKDRKITSWRDWAKSLGPGRAWFASRYFPDSKTVSSGYFTVPMLKNDNVLDIHVIYDTNIYVPSPKRQVTCNRLALDAWRVPKKQLALNPAKLWRGKGKKTATWFC